MCSMHFSHITVDAAQPSNRTINHRSFPLAKGDGLGMRVLEPEEVGQGQKVIINN